MRDIFDVFINFFAAEFLTVGIPEFHLRVWKLMTSLDLKRIVIAIPRGHAKTTLAKLAVVWHFLFTPITFIVYVGNTADSAVNAVKDVMDFFDNPNFIKVFGVIQYEVEKRGEGEFIFFVNTPFHGRKRCILKARGCGQQLRGLNIGNMRPQLAIVDDLEDAEDLQNEELRKKNKHWFFGTFIKALDRQFNKVVFIGNLIDRNCLLKVAIDSPRWHSMVLGCILKNGQPLWPELWGLTELIEDFQEYQRLGLTSLWFAEMMNVIIAGDNAIIMPEDIHYLPKPMFGVAKHGFITIDPATGVGANKTAIVVHVLLPHNDIFVPMIVDYRWGQFGEKETVEIALELAFTWGVRIIAIESVAYQRALAVLFQILMIQRGITGFDILKTYPGNSSKNERIRAFAAMCKSEGYYIFRGDLHLTNQLLAYDAEKRDNDDDLIDGAAQGLQVIYEFRGLIMNKTLQAQAAIGATREHQLG